MDSSSFYILQQWHELFFLKFLAQPAWDSNVWTGQHLKQDPLYFILLFRQVFMSSWWHGFIAKTKQKHLQPTFGNFLMDGPFFSSSLRQCWKCYPWHVGDFTLCEASKTPAFCLVDLLLSFRQWCIAKLSLPLKLGSWAVIWNKQLGLQWEAVIEKAFSWMK